MFKRRRRKTNNITDVSMTPLIDTALTLLIIFMITTPMIQNAIKVNLPKGNAKEDGGAQQDLVVYVDAHNDIYFNGKKTASTALISSIAQQVANQSERTVYVKADTAVAYGKVLELVDDIKMVGGVQYVALATTKRT